MNYLDEANEQLQSTLDAIDRDRAEQINELEQKEKELLDRLDRLKEEKHKIAAENGSVDVSDDDLIQINAGGKIIAAKRGTLTQLRDSRFEALFSGRWDKKLAKDKNGRIFLDVNGDCFQAIVDYLNELAISSEDEQPALPSVDDELGNILEHQMKIFGISIHPPIDSTIVSRSSDAEIMRNWLREAGEYDARLELLYRSSIDGLSASNFHSKCGNKGHTIVIIETTEGGVIGGYTTVSWTKYDGNFPLYSQSQADNKAFLFALSGFGLTCPNKMSLIERREQCAVCCSSSDMPIFGRHMSGTHDFIVRASSVTLELNIGHTYERGSSECLESRSYKIKEMEVFRVVADSQDSMDDNAVTTVERFSQEVNNVINNKWAALRKFEEDVLVLEENFKHEEQLIKSFGSNGANDIVTLNISGTIMATSRQTLLLCKESVLARQFDNSKWTEQGSFSVKDWSPDDVTNWVKSLKGISDDIATLFSENEIQGLELLALDKEGLKDIGVKRTGTICLLMKEIKRLDDESQDNGTLIEYSPYCFGKILDYLRLKHYHSLGLIDEPSPPDVCESQQKRFEKIVKYYFPGDSSNFILGTCARKRQRTE